MDTQDKRAEILKAANDCFARYGYEKTTLDDIGRLVGLNKASLYYYYKNKESIYTEVIFTEANKFISGALAQTEQASGCREKILTYFHGRLLFIKGSLNFNQLSRDSVEKIAPLFNKMYEAVLEQEISNLAAILDLCGASGQIVPCDSRRVAQTLLTVCESVRFRIDCVMAAEGALERVLDETNFVVSLILNGLVQKQPAEKNL